MHSQTPKKSAHETQWPSSLQWPDRSTSKSVSYDHFSVKTSYVPIQHYWHSQTLKICTNMTLLAFTDTQNLYAMITSAWKLAMYQYDIIGRAANIMWVTNDRSGMLPSNCTKCDNERFYCQCCCGADFWALKRGWPSCSPFQSPLWCTLIWCFPRPYIFVASLESCFFFVSLHCVLFSL